jgi:hypothetical protein
MNRGEYYSILDLANISGQPMSVVTDVVKFLADYGFLKQIGRTEPVFTRSSIILSPTQSMNILLCMANK